MFGVVTVRGNCLRAVYDATQEQRCREIRVAPGGHIPGEGECVITSVDLDIDIEKLAEFF
jgi:hypothetical protein